MIKGEPTKAQEKSWLERIARYADEYGAFPLSDKYNYQMHHIRGRTYKHNKVHIGRWAVIPIMARFHDVNSNNSWNVTHWPKRYEIEFGRQRDQFYAMCMVIKDEDGELPFSDDVLHAVMELKV